MVSLFINWDVSPELISLGGFLDSLLRVIIRLGFRVRV